LNHIHGQEKRKKKRDVKGEHSKRKSDSEVEWYSERNVYTYPRRVKVDGIWEDVFSYEKSIREHSITRKREVIFRCHIGDNRIVEIAIPDSTIS
jgi:hypothetical protein